MILEFNQKQLDLNTPKCMGIVNLTPDSFYDGGKLKSDIDLLNIVEKHLNEGASILDFGAYSSRPGAQNITTDEEKKRLIPVLEFITNRYPNTLISVDTFRAEVANEALKNGAFMINDISGGTLDNSMYQLIGNKNIPYVLMHMRGTPQTMTSQTDYDNLVSDIKSDLKSKINDLESLGGKQIILDLGYGFAKNIYQNFELLNHSDAFIELGYPILTGVSRKSMIYKTLNTTAKEALNGTTVLHTVALLKGSKLLRVHDVKEAVEAIRLTNEIIKA